MLDKVLRTIFTLFLAITGGALLKFASPLLATYISTEFFGADLGIFQLTVAGLICILTGALLGGLGGWFASPFLLGKLRRFTLFVEKQLGKMPIHDVIAGACGLTIGLKISSAIHSRKFPSWAITFPSFSASSSAISASTSPSKSAANSPPVSISFRKS